MTEINNILSISTIDGLLKYEITVKTILLVAVISGLVSLIIVIYFGGIRNTIDYGKLKLNAFLNAYGVKVNIPVSHSYETKINASEYKVIDKGTDKVTDKVTDDGADKVIDDGTDKVTDKMKNDIIQIK